VDRTTQRQRPTGEQLYDALRALAGDESWVAQCLALEPLDDDGRAFLHARGFFQSPEAA
jgi:hypothetical protein